MDLGDYIRSKLDQFKNSVAQGAGNVASAVGHEFQQLPQQIGNDFQHNPLVQGVNNFGSMINSPQAQQFGQQVAQNPLVKPILNSPLPVPFLPGNVARPTIGQYAKGQLVKPALTALNPKADPVNRLSAAVQTGFNALAPAETAAYNIGTGGVAGAIKTLRQGGNLNQNISQSMANPSDIGGTGLGIKNPLLAMGVDVAAGNPQAVVGGAKTLAQGLKGYSPNAFNIHPDDQKIMSDFVNAVQSGSGKGELGQLGKDAQVLAEHYIGKSAKDISNQKLAQAFDALLASAAKNRGEDVMQTQFPKMGFAASKSSSGQMQEGTQFSKTGTVPTQAAIKARVSEPLPWESNALAAGDENINKAYAGGKYQATNGISMNTRPEPPFQNDKPITPPGDIGEPNKQDIKLSKLSRFEANQDIHTRANLLARSLDNHVNSPQDVALFRDTLEHPTKLEANAAKAENPQAFKQLVGEFQQFTGHTYNAQINSGNSRLGKVENYFPHIFDMENPKVQELIKQKETANEGMLPPSKNSNSFVNKPRTFKDLSEAYQWAAQNGIKPEELMKNQSLGADVQDFAKANSRDIGSRLLASELQKRFPSEVYVSKSGEAGPPGLLQSRIIGNGGTYLSPRLIKATENLEPGNLSKPLKALDDVNAIQKGLKLAGGGFHYYNVGKGYAATSLAQGKRPSVVGTTRAIFSQGYFDDSMKTWANNGTLEKAGHMGVDINANEMQATSVGDKIQKYIENNPLTKPLFKRMIPYMQMKLVEGSPKFDLSTDEGKKAALDYGRQINMAVGILNNSIGDSIIKSPILKFASRQTFLAPMYNEAKFGQLASALNVTKWDKPHNLARGSIILGALITAGIAEGVRKIITGNFSPDLKSAITNDFLDPNVPLPFKDNKGRRLVAKLPGSAVTDLPRLASDPLHYAQSHLGANASDALSFITNKNYYGNALSNDNNPLVKTGKLAYNDLPIPAVQALEAMQGKESWKAAGINTIGGRVALDKNDPQVASTNAYFDGLKKTRATLSPDDQAIFDSIHPTKQDAEGNKIPTDKNAYTSPAKYETLLSNPKVMAAELAFQQSQPSHDPLWDWSPAQRQAYMQAQVISKNDPGGDKTTTSALYSVIPQQLFDQRTAYFNQLQSSGKMPQGSGPQSPQAPSSINAYTALPKGTGARTAFLQQHPELLKYFQDSSNYTNAQRADLGLPLLAQYGSGGGSGGSGGSGGVSALTRYKQKKALRLMTKPHKRGAPKIKLPKAKKSKLKTPKIALRKVAKPKKLTVKT